MASSIFYKGSALSELRRLDKPVARRILDTLKHALAPDPSRGIPLHGEFHGFFKYRIGDYRIIYAKVPDGILVLRIRHRKDAYRE